MRCTLCCIWNGFGYGMNVKRVNYVWVMHALKANGLIFLVNSYNVEDNLEPNSSPIPLVIMTSEKAHDHIWDLLITNKFYGMKPEQIHLFKQVNTKFDFVAKGSYLFFCHKLIIHGPCEVITSKKLMHFFHWIVVFGF